MINKGHTGSGFRGLKDYLLHGSLGEKRPDRVDWIDTRNLPNDDPHLAAKIMRATADQSARSRKPVYHMMISWPDGEEPDRDQVGYVVDRHLEALDLSEHQALVVAHKDTDHAHVHVIVNRVHPESLRSARLSWDYAKREQCRRELEREMGLEEVYAPHVDYDGRYGLTQDQKRDEHRPRALDLKRLVQWGLGKVSEIKAFFKEHIEEATSWADLEERAAPTGAELHRKGQGIILTDGRNYAKWSQISPRKHRLGELEKRYGQSFEQYERERLVEGDLSAMERIRLARKPKSAPKKDKDRDDREM